MFFSPVGAVMSQRLSDSCLLSPKDDEKKAAMQIASFARHGTAHHTALLHTKNEQVLSISSRNEKEGGKVGSQCVHLSQVGRLSLVLLLA